MNGKMNWEQRISSHNMKWTKLPENWTEAPFLGNGCIGVQLYHNSFQHALHLELGRNDICDTRQDNLSGIDICYQNPSLPIGANLFKDFVERFFGIAVMELPRNIPQVGEPDRNYNCGRLCGMI